MDSALMIFPGVAWLRMIFSELGSMLGLGIAC